MLPSFEHCFVLTKFADFIGLSVDKSHFAKAKAKAKAIGLSWLVILSVGRSQETDRAATLKLADVSCVQFPVGGWLKILPHPFFIYSRYVSFAVGLLKVCP